MDDSAQVFDKIIANFLKTIKPTQGQIHSKVLEMLLEFDTKGGFRSEEHTSELQSP